MRSLKFENLFKLIAEHNPCFIAWCPKCPTAWSYHPLTCLDPMNKCPNCGTPLTVLCEWDYYEENHED